ncbi:hypothetical protein GP486_003126 [Trichoglossum hirsutum]|uniref:Uncharacterized protein n=1 Tax=Trichoglossum hirsutum TaxID=265104 RepID=A0A9P8LDN7_9PEZI|nr:hypothetical protein GP486_003126 [Trichoglossum hirsutum]
MYTLLNSKRVRRGELYSTESSGAEDSVTDGREIEGLLKAKLEESYNDGENLGFRDAGDNGSGSHVGGDEFEFRLFSSTGPDSKPSKPGCALPWRVTTIKMTRLPTHPQASKNPGTISTSHRKRPGKKRRMLLRKKMTAKLEHEERVARERTEKETAMREKRTRKNRKKKIKRRMKENIKKAGEDAARGAAEAAAGKQAISSDKEDQKDRANEAPFAAATAAR